MVIKQEDTFAVESVARSYFQDGTFAEPFRRCYIYNLDANISAELDLNGPVPLPPRVLLPFDCGTQGRNVTTMYIRLKGGAGIVIYWTQYEGMVWNQ